MNRLNKPLLTHLHLLLLSGLSMGIMLRTETLVRQFLQYNLYIVIAALIWQYLNKNHKLITQCLKLASFPAALILISYIATGECRYKSYTRNLILGYGFLLNLLFLSLHDRNDLVKNCGYYVKSVLVIYTVAQVMALLIYSKPYGTTSNPHFLAVYSAIGMLISGYYFLKSKQKIRYVYLLNGLILGGIVLYTSSRPTWIGLIISTFFCADHFTNKNIKKPIALFVGVQAFLIIGNIFNYESRFLELFRHITVEERTVIWADTWKMQKLSNFFEWLVGHGLTSFYKDFQPFSRFHYIQDFRSPHNLVLEILYTTGISGLLILFTGYYLVYSYWLSTRKEYSQYSMLCTVALMATTTSLVLNGLNFPFCSTSFIYPFAFICGLLILVRSAPKSQ